MLQLSTLLQPEQIQTQIYCTSKKQLFERLAEILASQIELPTNEATEETVNLAQICLEALFHRERLGHSSLGCGMAFPKGRIPLGDKPVAAFIQLAEGLEYENADQRAVELVFALLIPEHLCEEIAKDLPQLAERLKEKAFCKALSTAENSTAVWEILLENDKAILQKETMENIEESE